MKRIFALFMLLVVPRLYAEEMNAQQILQKAFDALGGKQKLEKVRTRYESGKVEVRGLSGTYELWNQSPDRMKQKLDLSVIKVERGYDGTNGWVKQAAIVEQQGADLLRIKRNALFMPLFYYVSNNVPFQSKGKGTIEGKEAYILEFTPSEGSPEQFYIDAQSFLLLREVRQAPTSNGSEELSIDYSDYREVEGVKFPFTVIQTQPNQVMTVHFDTIQLNVLLDQQMFHNPSEQYAGKPYEIEIKTIPHHVYKENDGIWEPGKTENFYFWLVLTEKYSRPVEPVSATIEFYSGKDLLKTIHFEGPALASLRHASLGGFANVEEVFDLTHSFQEQVAPEITRLLYTLEAQTPEGTKLEKKLEIPLERYVQKTKLIFPLKGNFVVGGGHDSVEVHSDEWSQHYAYDIIGLGPNYEVAKNSGKTNEDFYMWGMDVLAPADGTVVFARNDIPDNQEPRNIEESIFMTAPDPMQAVGGNNVIIDHENGEFSFLAHMQKGSVRVKTGDKVKQGAVIGKLGNSGNSDAPHLHYHLMACRTIFRCDGLPSHFENLVDFFAGEPAMAAFPKRGVYLTAK